MSKLYQKAFDNLTIILLSSGSAIELSHAANTLKWLKQLSGRTDEIMYLAAYGHDIERLVAPKVRKEDFGTYTEYKKAHAERSASIAAEIAKNVGYCKTDVKRLRDLIKAAEFESDIHDVQLICDADSISFFDNNIEEYISKNGVSSTKKKVKFMYMRARPEVQALIDEILERKALGNYLESN